MIEIHREGRNGNLLEKTGPVLFVDFGDRVVAALFRNQQVTHRYMELKHIVAGFAPEDKFHVVPVLSEEIARGLKKDIGIWTDPGGDISLELSRAAGVGRKFGEVLPRFAIEEISSNPAGLLERGIDTLVLPALFAIEQERLLREMWGRSDVDPTWRRSL